MNGNEQIRWGYLEASAKAHRRYAASILNYRRKMWDMKDQLPQGWEGIVWSFFNVSGWWIYTLWSDEQGGRPPREHIEFALESLGIIESSGQVYLRAYRAMLRRGHR